MAGDARRAVAHDLLPDVRPEPVGADQRRALTEPVARCTRTLVAVLLVAQDLAAGAELDQLVVAAGLEEHAVQVAAVDHGIGVAEPLAERLVERDADDLLGGERVHQPKIVDEHGDGAGGVADAKLVEAVEGVGAELDAGADLAQHGRPLQHEAPHAFAGEAEGRGKAADAAAGDDEGLIDVAHGLSSPDPAIRRASACRRARQRARREHSVEGDPSPSRRRRADQGAVSGRRS